MGVEVHAHVPGLEDSGSGLGGVAGPAQHRPDPGRQLGRAEGLGDVVVGTQLEPEHPVHLLAARGQHDHRRPRGLPDPAEDVASVSVREHDVEENEVGRAAVEECKALRRRVGDDRVEALAPERGRERLRDRPFVLDQQDRSLGHPLATA